MRSCTSARRLQQCIGNVIGRVPDKLVACSYGKVDAILNKPEYFKMLILKILDRNFC